MWKNHLCLGILGGDGEPEPTEQLRLFKEIGFDGFFINWKTDTDVSYIRRLADDIGMIFQSIHAPFVRIDSLWKNDDRTETMLRTLLRCTEDCAKSEVPIMVCHAFIGFNEHTPTEIGLENFRKIVVRARELGVKIAFENTEGEEYLSLLMDHLREFDNVGFCWDTGHEMCYNHNKDMLSLYGDRLIATHLNDNLGIKDFRGNIAPQDDLHLLPFDGAADWKSITARLNKWGHTVPLTFELKRQSTDKREHKAYQAMTFEEYVTEAYKRACRVAMLKIQQSEPLD